MFKRGEVNIHRRLIGGLLLFTAMAAVSAQADAMTVYNLNYVFSPATGTVAPMGKVTITDLGTAVRFDLMNLAGAGTKCSAPLKSSHLR